MPSKKTPNLSKTKPEQSPRKPPKPDKNKLPSAELS